MKLHLGCGKVYIPGFIHVDVRRFPHVDHISSVDNLQMFEDNSIDLVYACHLLEHFHRDKTTGVLTEWKRVLRSGGVLRLAVPDFESVAKVYQKNGDVNSILGLVVGRQDYIYNIHYMIFDFISLSTILQEVGFSSVKRYDWRDTIHKDFDDYSQAYIPHMDKENGVLMSLNVEAVK